MYKTNLVLFEKSTNIKSKQIQSHILAWYFHHCKSVRGQTGVTQVMSTIFNKCAYEYMVHTLKYEP